MSRGRRDQATLGEFVNERGEYYGATLASEWHAPEQVELCAGVLTIRSRLAYWSSDRPGRVIKPPHRLLDSFITLGTAYDAYEATALSDLPRLSTPSDRAIWAFANRYGGLQIYYEPIPGSQWPVMNHREHCAVWRYFAQGMGSLLRIGAEFYRGRTGQKEDWENIHQVPSAMRQMAHRASPGLLDPFPAGDEENWLHLVSVRK